MPLDNADRQEIRDMILTFMQNNKDKIKQFFHDAELAEQVAAKVIDDAALAIAITWWNTVKPAVPTTRVEAVAAFKLIEGLLTTETDKFRLRVLRNRLKLADEKFKELKLLG